MRKKIIGALLILGMSTVVWAADDDKEIEANAPCCESKLQSTVGQEMSDAKVLDEANRLFGKVDKDGAKKSKTTQ